MLLLLLVLKNFGSVLLFLFKSKPMCSVAKDQALSLTSSKTMLSLINTSGMSHFINIAWLLKSAKGCEILSVGHTTDCSVGRL